MPATPNPDHSRYQAGIRDHLLLHFGQHAKLRSGGEVPVLDGAEGVYVRDTAGNRYLDALSCLFCAQLGYSYGPEFAEAASAQLTTMPFNTNWNTAHPAAIELAERLAELAPPGINRAFFTSGGSESVESAWKLARLYHVANGEPGRTKAIARRTAYHGLTLGALAFTGIPALKEPFGPPAVQVSHAPNTNSFRAPDADEAAFTKRLLAETEATILAADPSSVGMLIAEPVQNAGGCFTAPDGYWAGLRELADRYGFLLVADEVITGFGRIGEYFAVSASGATPDMITTAKGLTSAYAPMGAVMVSDKVAEPLYEPGRSLTHGITFAGHPLSAAIALRNLEIFERDKVLDNVAELTPHLAKRFGELAELPVVGDARGAGFFYAAELVAGGPDARLDEAQRALLMRELLPKRMRELGLIARTDERGEPIVQIAPPLVCDRSELDLIVDRLGTALTEAGEAIGLG
ncbi:MAG TPA: aminotransferase class III-fold pyridoxal phosphate-dependent enzyme [Pseudonocardiaceae bacterium]|jgi:adenosylmethionine-8-amino-7-oxononanoate aminotransferase|nr:aminotransferase class III-fold pyridoxal phosphate-dependent enzyme [Pseudonocardiaceae bacterium]